MFYQSKFCGRELRLVQMLRKKVKHNQKPILFTNFRLLTKRHLKQNIGFVFYAMLNLLPQNNLNH